MVVNGSGFKVTFPIRQALGPYSYISYWLLMYGVPIGEAHPSGLRHKRGRRLWFDVSEVPVGERIVSAELRLFLSEGAALQRATVSVYQLVEDDRG
jgi:hypothetical protein